MTIFTRTENDKNEKKADNDDLPPEVVTENKLLVDQKKVVPPGVTVRHGGGTALMVMPHRRHPMLRLCAILVTLVMMIILAFLGVVFYQKWTHEMLRTRCGVRYHERFVNNDYTDDAISDVLPLNGEFDQEVTIEDMSHERLEVPAIGDMRHATVLHDFNQNITAIIDREQQYCFLLPLNRTLVMPPRDFFDLLIKLKTGYYIPDVDIIRENYRALTPPVTDLSSYGYSIAKECLMFSTYRLVRDDEPIAMSKRSAPFCQFAGEKWCLGDAGASKMLCINIKNCL